MVMIYYISYIVVSESIHQNGISDDTDSYECCYYVLLNTDILPLLI